MPNGSQCWPSTSEDEVGYLQWLAKRALVERLDHLEELVIPWFARVRGEQVPGGQVARCC